MTIIAWDGKTLAADKRSCGGSAIAIVTKIRRASNGHLMASCGDVSQGVEMFAWYAAGADAEKFPAMQRDKDDWAPLLVIRLDGSVWRYERSPHPWLSESPFYAMGSGRDFALAALHLGRTAKEAVEVASALCCDCGNGVDTLTLEL